VSCGLRVLAQGSRSSP